MSNCFPQNSVHHSAVHSAGGMALPNLTPTTLGTTTVQSKKGASKASSEASSASPQKLMGTQPTFASFRAEVTTPLACVRGTSFHLQTPSESVLKPCGAK